tara:strand:+ start:95 stop:514 length:420 start_codon:yes stop_codon:yes gene_type:complete
MAIQNVTKINFSHSVNSMVQIGDIIYWNAYNSIDGFQYINNEDVNDNPVEPRLLGKVVEIGNNFIITDIVQDNQIDPDGDGVFAPNPIYNADGFITCHKNVSVNETGTKGYYADVLFKNDSHKAAELFSVGSEITLSSK